MLEILTILNDYDWKYAFDFAGKPEWCVGSLATGVSDPVVIENVVELLAFEEGANDGPEWICLGRVKDGRYFFLSAGCDYTGWECQADGRCLVSDKLETIMQFALDANEKERLFPAATKE